MGWEFRIFLPLPPLPAPPSSSPLNVDRLFSAAKGFEEMGGGERRTGN